MYLRIYFHTILHRHTQTFTSTHKDLYTLPMVFHYTFHFFGFLLFILSACIVVYKTS